MKIKNETRFETRVIRSIVCAVYARLKSTEGALRQWRHVQVSVVYARQQRGASGRAIVGGTWVKLCIPSSGCEIDQFAAVVEHELLHAYGHHHDTIGCFIKEAHLNANRWALERFGAFLLPRPLPGPQSSEQRAAAARARAAQRLERLRERLVDWERRAKTAARMVSKLRAKVRDRERRRLKVAAAKAPAP